MRDKLWFFLSGRYQAADLYVPGMFHNKNANNPNAWTYVADTSRQAVHPREFQVYQGRLTLQANPKNKFGVTYDLEPTASARTTSRRRGRRKRAPTGASRCSASCRWTGTHPFQPQILIEASAIHRVERWGGMHLQTGDGGNVTSLDPRMIGSSTARTGLTYRAAAQGLAPGSPPYNNSWNKNLHYRAALSYITGSHVIKVGFNNAWGYFDDNPYTNRAAATSTTSSTAPRSRSPSRRRRTRQKVEVDRDLGFFVQDKWTTQPMDPLRGHSLRPLQEQLPRADARADVLHAESERRRSRRSTTSTGKTSRPSSGRPRTSSATGKRR